MGFRIKHGRLTYRVKVKNLISKVEKQLKGSKKIKPNLKKIRF